MAAHKSISILPVFIVFVLLPFFEGGETSSGLFLFHTSTLLALAVAAFTYSRLHIPRFLFFFVPFFLALLISTFLSAYKYAAFLKLWDYVMGGLWAILVCGLIRENKDQWESSLIWLFCAGAISSVFAIVLFNRGTLGRVSASFLNPNEFATLALMMLCLGMFLLEQEINPRRKTLIAVLSGLILLSIGLSLSRGIFLASLCVAFAAFLKRKPGKTVKAVLILLIVISGALVAIRLKYYDDPLKYERWKIWKSSLRGISEDPYLGIGFGMLEYRARMFNFPAESELARYGRIARSADSLYVEILAETGFLGLLSFLFGWIFLFLRLRKTSDRYFYLRLAWLIISIVSLFSVPLQNTSVLFFFLFLVVIPFAHEESSVFMLPLKRTGRVLIPVVCFLLFVAGSYLPFQSDREFYRAVQSKDLYQADAHLNNAIRYNPYQPYYRFYFIRKIVDSKPDLNASQWSNIISLIDQSIRLNPLEYEFHLYKGRVYRRLMEKEANLPYYSASILSYQTALDFNPYNVFLRLEFASFLSQLKRYDLAENEARKAIETEPVFLNARLLLTNVLLSEKKFDEARKEYAAFHDYRKRYGRTIDPRQTVYIRSLLEVNEQQEQRIQTMLMAESTAK